MQVDALGFGGQARGANNAAVDLLDHVEAYFMSGANTAESYGKTHITKLSPIYLQRFGHSMTIVGLERLVDGSRKLLVFDSSFATSVQMKRLASQQQALCSLEGLLRPYRKSDLSLTRFDEFEIIVYVVTFRYVRYKRPLILLADLMQVLTITRRIAGRVSSPCVRTESFITADAFFIVNNLSYHQRLG